MPQYSLHWQEGHGFRSDPEPFVFRASGDKAAFVRTAEATGTALVRGKLNRRAFHAAGAEELRRNDGTRVFPPPKRSRKSRNVIRGRRKVH